jgi:hypothetical protein
MESYLLSNQINQYAKALVQDSIQGLHKAYSLNALGLDTTV